MAFIQNLDIEMRWEICQATKDWLESAEPTNEPTNVWQIELGETDKCLSLRCGTL